MKYILFSYKKLKAVIIDEDDTHLLIKLESGTKLATSKSLHKIYEEKQKTLFD